MNLFNQMRPDNALVDTNVVPMDTSEDLYDDPFGGYSDDLVTDALNVDPISSDYYDTHAVKNRISNQNQNYHHNRNNTLRCNNKIVYLLRVKKAKYCYANK